MINHALIINFDSLFPSNSFILRTLNEEYILNLFKSNVNIIETMLTLPEFENFQIMVCYNKKSNHKNRIQLIENVYKYKDWFSSPGALISQSNKYFIEALGEYIKDINVGLGEISRFDKGNEIEGTSLNNKEYIKDIISKYQKVIYFDRNPISFETDYSNEITITELTNFSLQNTINRLELSIDNN